MADSTAPADAPLGLRWGGEISNRQAKEAIGATVAARAEDGQTIGLGSGSTAFITVLALGERVRSDGLHLRAVPTSIEIALAADAVGLQVVHVVPDRIDWCFDGADEVDPEGRLIKGRGGALLRERVVFTAAEHRLLVADESKSVDRLGTGFPVPVEVDPLYVQRAHDQLLAMDHVTEVGLRMAGGKDGPIVTEGGGVILDVRFDGISAEDEAALDGTAGVRGTGIFSGFDYERLA